MNMDMQPDCTRGDVCASCPEEAAMLSTSGCPASSRLLGRLLLPASLIAVPLPSAGSGALPSGFRALLPLPQLHHLLLFDLDESASASTFSFEPLPVPVAGLLSESVAKAWLGKRLLKDLPGVGTDRSGCSVVSLDFLLLKKLRRLSLGCNSFVR